MSVTTWTEEHDATLRVMLAEGLPHAAIAHGLNAKFGTAYTKNASVGRTKRLGLCGPVKVASEESRAKTRERDREKKRIRREALRAKGASIISANAGKIARRLIAPALPNDPFKLRCVEITPRNLTLMDLEPNDCRYPYGEGSEITFCGHAQMPGASYCMPHFELCRGEGTYSERRAA